MIHLLYTKATPEQVRDMLQVFHKYIKLAIDIERCVLAGGGSQHADSEFALLESGSNNDDIWGADWNPFTQELLYDAFLNIRPALGNRSTILSDPTIRSKMAFVVSEFLEGVEP